MRSDCFWPCYYTELRPGCGRRHTGGLGGLELPSEAILYSVDSMSTRGASGLMLEHHWHMLGALEAMDGMLLFGMSTAFIFVALQGYWPPIPGSSGIPKPEPNRTWRVKPYDKELG